MGGKLLKKGIFAIKWMLNAKKILEYLHHT